VVADGAAETDDLGAHANWVRTFWLTPAHQKFIDEYLKNGRVAYKAYMVAFPGCSAATARVESSKLVKHPNIDLIISTATRLGAERVLTRSVLTVEKFFEQLEALILADPRNIIDFGNRTVTLRDLTNLPLAVVQSIESVETKDGGVKVKFSNRLTAMEMWARLRGVAAASTGGKSDLEAAASVLARPDEEIPSKPVA